MSSSYVVEDIRKEIERVLNKSGYPRSEKEKIVACGGRNNGTIDLKATSDDRKKAIVVEIKSFPITTMCLAHFFRLKENLEKRKYPEEKTKYYMVLINKDDVIPSLQEFSKTKGIEIISLNDFIKQYDSLIKPTV